VNTAVLPSTLLLTVLLSVGLFFFIRASVKDRTQTVKLESEQSEASLMTQLQQYFTRRSYQIVSIDPEQKQIKFEGFVRPSFFLAIFLTLLAAAGILCLSLVLSFFLPSSGSIFLGFILLAPGAGVFYWKKAGRKERVAIALVATASEKQPFSKISVTAHRDELIELQQNLRLKPSE
jgi:hypothetical protein